MASPSDCPCERDGIGVQVVCYPPSIKFAMKL
uniref:Uncharacterized protein n=1 Tax=Rhizophora mucronata TaxID=61149 RepID=A0A2P2MIG5_RHIMU